MGLASRKQKQRVPEDPRNLSWADDASRFGLSYLSKFGWDPSQGLGASGEGMKTHLKVQKKLDMMGIGAQHQRDPGGIAWKQNKEFEALLKRLNEVVKQEGGIDGKDSEGENTTVHETGMDGRMFVCAEEKVEKSLKKDSSVTGLKKRKRRDKDESGSGGRTRKKGKKEMVNPKISGSDIPAAPTIDPNSALSSAPSSFGTQSEPIPKPRPMAHRARIRAAKRIVDKSASAISEILGIAPSSSVSTSTPTPAPTPPFVDSLVSEPSFLSLDNLTTSTKSVADYFKEKLLSCPTTSAPPPLPPSDLTTPGLCVKRPETGSPTIYLSEEDDRPRRGIGSRDPAAPRLSQTPMSGLASRDGSDDIDDQETLTGKMRRKVDRKAEKRRRRKAEAVCVSSVTAQVEEVDAESAQRTQKREKRKKGRREYQKMPVGDDGITDTSSSFPPGPMKRSIKEHKMKCL